MSRQTPAIPPYWTRLGSFFLYPLSLESLLACCGFALLAGFASMLFLPVNLLVWGALLVVTLRYGYSVLERTARGYLDDSQILFDSAHGGKHLPYKQFLIIAVALSLCVYLGSILGPHPAMVLLVLFAMLLPASTMLLAVTDDLGESMSPPRLWGLIRGIGMPYLGLCACLLLLSSGHGALLGLLSSRVPEILLGAISGFLGGYFIIVMFRLMGYVLYQYHEEAGLAVDVDFERQAVEAQSDPALRRAEQSARLLKEGRYDEAIAQARADTEAQPGDLTTNLRLHRLLLAVPGRTQAMLAHARDWLPSLVRPGYESYAIQVLEAIWQHQADYLPGQPRLILPLASAMLAAHRSDSTARLIRNFDRRFPGHADTPAIYLLGARLLIEYKHDEAQARRVLTSIRQHFPGNPAAAEAARLEELLDRLAATAPASSGPQPARQDCCTAAEGARPVPPPCGR